MLVDIAGPGFMSLAGVLVLPGPQLILELLSEGFAPSATVFDDGIGPFRLEGGAWYIYPLIAT